MIKFDKFSLKPTAQGIIWFTSNKQKIIDKETGASGHGYIITAEVIINNPALWDAYDKYSLGELRRDGYDGSILYTENEEFDCFVFSLTQIKIKKIEKV